MRDVLHGDCLTVMPTITEASVDAIVTDPPYALTANKKGGTGVASVNLASPYGRSRIGTGNGAGGFMGAQWDAAIPGPEVWREALRVAKPGAHLVAFGGTRTYHRLACAIEDAGWEIRDCLMWLYGTGFPKSHNGPWGGTALKPGWEPIVLARKPLAGTVAANVEAHGTGALNIDGCRLAAPDGVPEFTHRAEPSTHTYGDGKNGSNRTGQIDTTTGRWPANVCLDANAAAMLDAITGERSAGGSLTGAEPSRPAKNTYGEYTARREWESYGDTGGASRFFYCAKASRSEREAGLADRERKAKLWSSGTQSPGTFQAEGTDRTSTNHHPTVKPIALMAWLCRLVTPLGGLILDPFTGSGSTGCAAVQEGFRFIGIEREAEYVAIARQRIAHWTPDQLEMLA